MTKAKKIGYSLIACLMLIVIALSVNFSLAYFKYKKQFSSSGELPVLNLTQKITTQESDYLASRTIMYRPSDVDLKIELSTENNNINGYIRFSIWIEWLNGGPNEVLSEEGDLISVCVFEIDNTVWERRSGYYYLKNDRPIEPNETLTLFSKISFAPEVNDTYQFQTVRFFIVPEIIQATNKPANW